MASMETSAPFSPPLSARRSIRTGMAGSSLALPSTASWPSTRRLVVAKAETRCSGALSCGAIMAAARGLAVDGDEIRPVRPCLAHPGGEGGRKQRRIDPVHQQRQPAAAGNAVMDRADSGAGTEDAPRPRPRWRRSRRNRPSCRRRPTAEPPRSGCATRQASRGSSMIEKWSRSDSRRDFSSKTAKARLMAAAPESKVRRQGITH